MIFVILAFYVLPVLLWIDLLSASYKISKAEGDDVLLIYAIIAVIIALAPVVNLVFLVLAIRAIIDMSNEDLDMLSKYSMVFKFLFKKI